ncbi:CDP-glucose 4,6-dehydratase [Candidatus Woesearchaeota archaeon]|nr:CDP-glucose 4,6-dehydratase [Candidatus Woesearchaeota archaeon]
MNEFKNFYKNKNVLVTGHTGFKGSWLSLWLNELGANVIGLSLEPEYQNGVFVKSELKNKIYDCRGDIRNLKTLKQVFNDHKPDVVFHLAAQAIVRESYDNPIYTYEANVIGTANVLECIRELNNVKSAVMITSDKCYKNKELERGYNEDDELGGYDPYSSSKGCAELVINSYNKSYFSHSKTNIASARAGNVIGGGDWAKDRLIPDAVKALLDKKTIPIRNPTSTRPWQHVLDPLNGYLLLGKKLAEEKKFSGAWNFGPNRESILMVKEVIDKLIKYWGSGKWKSVQKENEKKYETKLLNLDCSKSKKILGWNPVLDINQSLKFSVDWYKGFNKRDVYELCKKQINDFTKISMEK